MYREHHGEFRALLLLQVANLALMYPLVCYVWGKELIDINIVVAMVYYTMPACMLFMSCCYALKANNDSF